MARVNTRSSTFVIFSGADLRAKLQSLLAALWVGDLWVTGFIVAPSLFDMLDRVQAGAVAARLFLISHVVSAVCGAALLLLRRRWDRVQSIVVAMLAVAAAIYLFVTPAMEAARLQSAVAFARWHGLAGLLFVANALLGAALVWQLAGARTGMQP